MTVIVMILAATCFSYAQSQYAVLSHEGTTQVFAGPKALEEANSQAVDGDIITLSAGQFKDVTITKSITLRGNGMDVSGNSTYLTCVALSPDSEDKIITVEGITTTGVNMQSSTITKPGTYNIVKCKMAQLNTNLSSGTDEDVRVIITNSFILRGGIRYAEIINSVVKEMYMYSNATNSVLLESPQTYTNLTNCLVVKQGGNSIEYNATNCILIHDSDRSSSYFTSLESYLKEKSPSSRLLPVNSEVFKAGSEIYELTDANASEWLGNDGTQIGIYGGKMPFSPLTTNPHFSVFKVAEKTTPEGMLNVELSID